MKLYNFLRILVVLSLAIIVQACGECGVPIPDNDSTAPTTGISMEYRVGGQTTIEDITQDTTINVPVEQHFVIIYGGNDEGGVKYLTLHPRWTQYVGHLPQSVTPLVAPADFSDLACTNRLMTERFEWEDVRVYRFYVTAEDFRGNVGRSPTLTVVHGKPPEPLEIP